MVDRVEFEALKLQVADLDQRLNNGGNLLIEVGKKFEKMNETRKELDKAQDEWNRIVNDRLLALESK